MILLAGPFLSMIDASVVNVAIGPMSEDLDAGLGTVQWTASAYLLALGAGLSTTSGVSRRYGLATTYRVSLLGFTVVSGLCALCTNVDQLIAARVVQGLFASALIPVAMSLLGPGAQVAVSRPAGTLLFVAPALGPSIGGLILANAQWNYIFLINVPIGLLSVLGLRQLPVSHFDEGSRGTRFDAIGVVLLAAGVTCVLLGADRYMQGWAIGPAAGLGALGLVLLVGYLRWEKRVDTPALRLDLMRDRRRAVAVVLAGIASVVAFAAVVLLPAFAQIGQGRSAWATGLVMIPQGLMTGVAIAAGESLLPVLGLARQAALGFAVMATASLALLAVGSSSSLVVVGAILVGRSAGLGLVVAAVLVAVTAGIPDAAAQADGNILLNVVERITASVGIALIVTYYGQEAAKSTPVVALHRTALILATVALAGSVLAVTFRAPSGTDPPFRGKQHVNAG